MNSADCAEVEREGNTDNLSLNVSNKSIKLKEVKRYAFTLLNYTAEDISKITVSAEKYKYLFVYGKEICPETGTPHLQGYLEYPNKITWLSLKNKMNIDKIHFEPCKGNRKSNIDYCCKDGDYYSNIEGIKKPKPIKLIEVLYPWQQSVVDYTLEEPDGRSILWIVDSVGNSGKSSFAKYMFVKHKCLVIQGGKLNDIMNIIFNSDMDEIRTVIIDIPRVNKNKVSYSSIECILNGMITNTKYETGIKVFNPPHVIVFSNFPPMMESLSEDRWIIKEL